MADITLKYGSTGFERVNSELLALKKRGEEAPGWFSGIGDGLKKVEADTVKWFKAHDDSFRQAAHSVTGLATNVMYLSAAIAGVAALAGGAAAAGFLAWSVNVLKTRESFAQLEISLYGALKSWDAVNKVSSFAKEYAATYPAMYGDIMKAMQSMAFIPSLKPAIERGDLDAMKELMHVVQGMMTMRPEQGVQGALFALREALAGNWRSLQFRFDIPVASIAKSAGMSMEQMKESPEASLKALKAWIDTYVGADTMAMSAKNLGIQVGNLKDKYDIWLDTLGKTGIYDKVVGYIIKLNDWMDNLMKSEKWGKMTEGLNKVMEEIAASIAGIFTKGINWDQITSSGDLLNAFQKVGKNALEEMRKGFEASKGLVTGALTGIIGFAAKATIDVAKDLFVPVGKSIVSSMVEGIRDSLKEHPIETVLSGGIAGAMLTPGGPKAKILGGIGGALATLLAGMLAPPKKEIEEPPMELGVSHGKKEFELAASHGPGYAAWRPPAAVAPWKTYAEQEFDRYRQWSRMGSALAAAPEEEPPTATFLFGTGAIPYEEFKKRQRMEDFRTKQMKMLGGIATMPEATAGLKTQLYGEMFQVSMGGGQFRQAEGYMQKSLEALVQSFKEDSEQGKEQLAAEKKTAENTDDMKKLLQDIKEQGKGSSRPESGQAPSKEQGRTAMKGSEEWSQDELKAQVRKALGE